MSGRIRTSLQGIELIKSFEGFRPVASRLPDGKWIIGHGHVRSAREGVTITPKDAEDLLRYDLRFIEEAMAQLVFAPLNQNQYDALASLVFNISPAQFRDSEILRRINAGDHLNAANGFDGWRRARINGRALIVDALVRRRAAEKALFLENPDGRPSAPTPLVVPEYDAGLMQAAMDETAETAAPRHLPVSQRPVADLAAAARSEMEDAITRGLEKLQSAQQMPPRAANDPPSAPQISAQIPVGGDRATVAARLARILDRSEKAVALKTAPDPLAAAAPRPNPRPVPEDLPDFDAPADPPPIRHADTVEPRPTAEPTRRQGGQPRIYIDDTEVYEPGRNPDDLFAEAEAKDKAAVSRFAAKIAAKPVEPKQAGERPWLLSLAPWIGLVAVATLGLAAAAYASITNTAGVEIKEPHPDASVWIAVFLVLLAGGGYFLLRRALGTSR